MSNAPLFVANTTISKMSAEFGDCFSRLFDEMTFHVRESNPLHRINNGPSERAHFVGGLQ